MVAFNQLFLRPGNISDSVANFLLPDKIISNQTYRIGYQNNQLIQKIFPVIDRTEMIQGSYFLYDDCNLVKKFLIKELSKFVSIYGGISYFGGKRRNFEGIVSPKNRLDSSAENLS